MKQNKMEDRIVRYGELIPCKTAFIDAHTPGSDQKENFTIIGGGVSESPDLARISGVNVRVIINCVWLIGASGAALGGVLYGLTVQLRPELGFGLILPLFAAAILGGAGSLYGAVIGGLIVGISENLSVMIIPTNYKPAVPFLLILAILYCRPQGLFGERPQ